MKDTTTTSRCDAVTGDRPWIAGRLAPAVAAAIGAIAARDAACAGTCEPLRVPEAIRIQGAPAPGTLRTFQNFDRPFASTYGGPGGWWAFTGDLDGDPATDDVLYAGDRLVLREGDVLPDSGLTIDAIPTFDGGRPMNAAGQVAAVVRLADVAAGTDEAVVRETELVARAGDPVPDGEGDVYESFSFVGLLDDGRVGFLAITDGPATRDSVVVLDGAVILREGDPVPWDPVLSWDGRFDELSWTGPGDLVFEGNTSAPSDRDRMLVVRLTDGDFAILAREGDAYATEKGPATLELFEQATISESGHWAARVLLRDVPPTLDEAVLASDGIVMREGDPIASVPGGFVGRPFAIAVDEVGRVAAAVDVAGSPPPGVTQALLVDGCAVTTTAMGATGLPPDTWLAWMGFEDLAARDDGTFVFTAGYGGSTAGDGLFAVPGGAGCPADLDGDGAVAAVDVLLLLGAWGSCPGFVCSPDLDLDGSVGMSDLLAVLQAFGPCDG